MTLFSRDELRDLLILFSIAGAGVFLILLNSITSMLTNSSRQTFCGNGPPVDGDCPLDYFKMAGTLLEAWARVMAMTTLPLLASVTVVVIAVRWICARAELSGGR